MNDRKSKLLHAFADEINKSDDFEEASVFTSKELDTPVDMVRCIVTEVGTDLINALGEFYFLPFENEEVLYFTLTITLGDEVVPESVSDLESAVSKLDFYLPYGCFALGGEGSILVYKYTVPFRSADSEDEQMSSMLTALDAAVTICDRFEGYLMLVASGELAPDDMISQVMSNGEG